MYINILTHLYMNLCTYDQFLYPGKIAKPIDPQMLKEFLDFNLFWQNETSFTSG